MRIVVIGGLGNFGARICKRLAQEPGLEVIATSRQPHSRSESIKTALLDLESREFALELKSLAPDLVIHCAGPFQNQDYRVALASLACKANYIDIADGRAFVTGFISAVGKAAEAAGRFAITGASTLPALSSAVIDSLERLFVSLNSIDIVIAPGQHAPRGAATMAAVLGYAGQSFLWWSDGRWCTVHGWQQLEQVQFSFGRRWAAACDVPDLELLPARYPGVRKVTFRAALEVTLQHYALWVIGACRRMGLALPAARWGTFLDGVGRGLNWLGSDTGGMRVKVAGIDCKSRRRCQMWELVAASNHGPEIPCMAAVILANRLHRGDTFVPGAQVCVGIIELSEFASEFARWAISTRISECTS
jgi:saccharopine dehydrogenase-like NADP-dependent oxidoreductase